MTLSLLAVASCGGAGARSAAGGPSVRDSAGIEIVDNDAPAWPADAGWTVADTPSVDIGGGQTPGTDLVEVTAAQRLTDGRLAVATVNAVHLFDPQGNHLATSGRAGSGPGEFQGIAGLWRGPGDSLLASDMMVQRLSVLTPTGDFARSFSLGGQAGIQLGAGGQFGLAIPLGQLADGSIVGMRMSFDLAAKHSGSYRDTVALLRYGPDGTGLDTVGRVPGMEMSQLPMTFGGQTVSTPSPVPLGKATVTAVGRDRLYLATNGQWEVEVRGPDGSVRRIIRVRAPAAPITAAEIAAHKQEQRETLEASPRFRSVPQQFKDQFLQGIDNASYPATKPWIAGITPSPDGALWIEEVGSPGAPRRPVAVLDSGGRFLGRLNLPVGFRMMAVEPEAVIGVWKDENDVEHVRVYSIRRP